MPTDYWTLYGTTEPTPDPSNPPPACLGQVWVMQEGGREGLVNDILLENGERIPYCFGLPWPVGFWPPEGAVLVSGPHAPWRG